MLGNEGGLKLLGGAGVKLGGVPYEGAEGS